jgi:hypothetical protein
MCLKYKIALFLQPGKRLPVISWPLSVNIKPITDNPQPTTFLLSSSQRALKVWGEEVPKNFGMVREGES